MATDDLTSIFQESHLAEDRLQDRWDRILAAVYDDVRLLARRYLRGELRGVTLQTTVLAHDAIERVVLRSNTSFKSRAHFYGAISAAIRRSLIDYARTRHATRRGAGRRAVSLDAAQAVLPIATGVRGHDGMLDVLAVEELLIKLESLAPQQAKLVELRYYAGFSVEEAAEALGISITTVERQWRLARAWLLRHLADDSQAGVAL